MILRRGIFQSIPLSMLRLQLSARSIWGGIFQALLSLLRVVYIDSVSSDFAGRCHQVAGFVIAVPGIWLGS